jgi:hypothetical protein
LRAAANWCVAAQRPTPARFLDHGLVAKETLLDLWERWTAWLDKYVKNPEKRSEKRMTTDQQERH